MPVNFELQDDDVQIRLKKSELQKFALTFLFAKFDEEVCADLLSVDLDQVTEEVYQAVYNKLFSLLPEVR